MECSVSLCSAISTLSASLSAVLFLAGLLGTAPLPAADGAKTNEEQFQVSVGYAFGFGLDIDIGWMKNRNDGIDTDTFGALLSYTYEF